MNILRETQRSLTDALWHYTCMRFKFRATVWRDEEGKKLTRQATEACQCCPAP